MYPVMLLPFDNKIILQTGGVGLKQAGFLITSTSSPENSLFVLCRLERVLLFLFAPLFLPIVVPAAAARSARSCRLIAGFSTCASAAINVAAQVAELGGTPAVAGGSFGNTLSQKSSNDRAVSGH